MITGEQNKLTPEDAARYIHEALTANCGPVILEK
jgi:hypothetical protein